MPLGLLTIETASGKEGHRRTGARHGKGHGKRAKRCHGKVLARRGNAATWHTALAEIGSGSEGHIGQPSTSEMEGRPVQPLPAHVVQGHVGLRTGSIHVDTVL